MSSLMKKAFHQISGEKQKMKMKNNSTCGLSLFHGKLKRNKEKEKRALEQKNIS